jgi:F0F1-type ATP synthase membrane subunit b/b'
VDQVQVLAERVVLVPVGASLLARDNLVATVRDLTARYRTRTSLERELKRYERRGVTARNRFERQIRRTRTRVERELRQRRRGVERTLRQNRRRFEREVRSVRRDLEKQSGTLTARVEKLVSEAQGRINAAS